MSHVGAVLRRIIRRHGVRNPVALLVPLVLSDVRDGGLVAGDEIADDEIGTRILPPLVRARRRSGPLRASGVRGSARAPCASRAPCPSWTLRTPPTLRRP